MAEEQTINLPQLLLVLLIGGLALRYFFFSGPSARTSPSLPSGNNNRAREADVERIQQMFPQISRRSIMWDLQRNGGNVAATTERILSGRGLEVPPQTFQPPLPVASPLSSTSSASSSPVVSKPLQPDLITRYNLSSKIASTSSHTEEGESTAMAGGKQAWSQNKSERQALLQRRREEMILAARKKMEAKVAAESATARGNPSVS